MAPRIAPSRFEVWLPVFMDRDLERYEVVWAAAGRPDAVFPISPGRLVELSGAQVSELA